ncbi:protein-tyrosine phosphatase, partial [Teratosphaeria destructans]
PRRRTWVREPEVGEVVEDPRAADWRGGEDGRSADFEKRLGLREADVESGGLSRASSVGGGGEEAVADEREGTKGHVPAHVERAGGGGLMESVEVVGGVEFGRQHVTEREEER